MLLTARQGVYSSDVLSTLSPTRRIRHSTAASAAISVITNFVVFPATVLVKVLSPILYSITYPVTFSRPYFSAVWAKSFQSRVRVLFSLSYSLEILLLLLSALPILLLAAPTVFVPTRRILHVTVESGLTSISKDVPATSSVTVLSPILYSIIYPVMFSTPYLFAVWAKSFQSRVRVLLSLSYVRDI